MLWANQALRQANPEWWSNLQHMQSSAVDAQGIPRYNTLQMADWLRTLLGQPTSEQQAEPVSPAGSASNPYPPQENSANCSNWNDRVQTLHPAAVR